jgi:hypothetical protein
MIFEIPFCDDDDVFLPGEPWAAGKLATSEKKNEVLTVGVRGVLDPAGVFMTEFRPPGLKRPFAVGDCSHASTLDVSNDPVTW